MMNFSSSGANTSFWDTYAMYSISIDEKWSITKSSDGYHYLIDSKCGVVVIARIGSSCWRCHRAVPDEIIEKYEFIRDMMELDL